MPPCPLWRAGGGLFDQGQFHGELTTIVFDDYIFPANDPIARPEVPEPDPGGIDGIGLGFDIVAHFQVMVIQANPDLERVGFREFIVFDGVFHEQLQGAGWYF